MNSVRDHRPAVVKPHPDPVYFIATASAVFNGPQRAVGVERRALRIPVAIRPNLRLRSFQFSKRVSVRNGPITRNPDDCAVVVGQILRQVRFAPLAKRYEQVAIPSLDNA